MGHSLVRQESEFREDKMEVSTTQLRDENGEQRDVEVLRLTPEEFEMLDDAGEDNMQVRTEKLSYENGDEFEVMVSTSPFQGEHEPGEPGSYTFEEWEALHPERFAATE